MASTSTPYENASSTSSFTRRQHLPGSSSRGSSSQVTPGPHVRSDISSRQSYSNDKIGARFAGSGPTSEDRITPRTSDTCDIPDVNNQEITSTDVVTHRGLFASDSDETNEGICLSVVWSGGKISVAYYDVGTTEMFLMPDTAETDDFWLISKILFQVKPSCVVTSAKEDERLLKAIKKTVEKDTNMDMDEQYIQVLPSVDFSTDMCKRRILNINLSSIPEHYDETERTLHLTSLIQFNNMCLVRAFGGLLRFVEKNRIGIQLEEASMRIPVLAIRMFSLEDLMLIDDQTFSALQIFQTVTHPSLYKISYREGSSLFRLLNRCCSKAGSKMLRLWFLQPVKSIEKLRERLNSVSYFSDPRHMEITVSLQKCLHQIRDTKRILARMTKAQATVGDWQTLYKTVYSAIYIGDVCKAQASNLSILQKIQNHFTDDLHKIANLISKIVDFDESVVQNRFVVKPNVDPELDEKKRTYRGLPDFMTQVAREELALLGDDISHCNVIYLPQLGYLLTIPVTDTMKETQDYDMPGLEFVFISNNVVHYKSARTKELDRMLGDTQCDITDYETGVMHKLQNIILEHCDVLVDIVHCAAELDCILSFASCAREFNYVKPEVSSQNVLKIKGGRHPIQESCCSIPFVPNDTYSGGEYSRMKVLTGPNASGKSVYLKQVAMIVYMAQIGSFVPAEQATIGLLDGIFTRIRTTESVSVGLSTFMIDLNQVSAAMNSATGRSLVLLDEFGKGTETADGLALLSASLQHWLDKKDHCPHVFVSTHFHSIIQEQLLKKSTYLTFQTMEVLRDGHELVFLYQLKDGHTNTSYACHVASKAGLPEEIVKRGSEVSKLLRENQPIHRVDTASTATQFKRCQAIVDRFMDLDLDTDDVESFLKEFVIPVYLGSIQP